jgi:hypothetical protein
MKSKRQRIDEGLQLSRAFMQKYGFTSLNRETIGVWCGCSGENIRQIEERALKKLRRYGIFKQSDLNYLCKIAANHYKIES